MLLHFSKMHGLGNDFMVVDNVTQNLYVNPDQIRRWADRHTGIGFDQMLLVEPPYDPDLDTAFLTQTAAKSRNVVTVPVVSRSLSKPKA